MKCSAGDIEREVSSAGDSCCSLPCRDRAVIWCCLISGDISLYMQGARLACSKPCKLGMQGVQPQTVISGVNVQPVWRSCRCLAFARSALIAPTATTKHPYPQQPKHHVVLAGGQQQTLHHVELPMQCSASSVFQHARSGDTSPTRDALLLSCPLLLPPHRRMSTKT